MAISVDWPNKIINVPKADLQLVQATPTEIRQLDIDAFRLELKSLEDDDAGMAYLSTHVHYPPVEVGGVTLARVIQIINGYTITFEDGQYAVNLTGANSNIGDNINVNQVSVRSANSAGLTFSEQINNQSYLDAAVYINLDHGLPGTSFPRGTPTDPVDNVMDAMSIANVRKFNNFHVDDSYIIFDVSENIYDTNWFSESIDLNTLQFSGNGTEGTVYNNFNLKGTLNGRIHAKECILDNVTNLDGVIKGSGLLGTITIDALAVQSQMFFNCYSAVPGTAVPVLNINNAVCDVQLRNYTGGLAITNVTQGQSISIDVLSGTITLDSSCTSGTIVIRGHAKVINNSTCTVYYDNTTYHGFTTINEGVKKASLLIPHNTDI